MASVLLVRSLLASCLSVVALVSLGGAGSAAGEPPDAGTSAFWAWSWGDAGELASFASERGFDRVYLFAEGGFTPTVRKAITALTADGIAVEALGGETRWATSQREGMLGFIRSARRYQRSAPAAAKLAGIHLDVEPHALPAWDQHEGRVARSLLASLRAARRAAGPLPLAADMPFWFDGIRLGRGPALAERMIAATDAVTLMAYRDDAGAIADVARREIAIAGRLGKRLTVGVETGDVRPEQVTFHEEGVAAVDAALAAVGERFGARPGYGGTAIHSYASLLELGD